MVRAAGYKERLFPNCRPPVTSAAGKPPLLEDLYRHICRHFEPIERLAPRALVDTSLGAAPQELVYAQNRQR
jgi:hypothetical protein